MKKMTLSVVIGMTALMIMGSYWGTASAQTNAGVATIGVASPGPFSLAKHGFHGGFGFGGWSGGWGGGWPYRGGYGSYYGSGYYDYPNYGTRTNPYQICTWTGYRWKCYNFDNSYDDSYY